MADEIGNGCRRTKQYKNPVICIGCSSEVARRSANQKYCKNCNEQGYRENNRKNEERKRRAAGIMAIGADVECPGCRRVYQRVNGAQRDCPSCSGKRRIVYERASKRKYEANNPPRKRTSEKDKARTKRWADKNRKTIIQQRREYIQLNSEAINAASRERNKTAGRKEWLRRWEANKRATDPKFRLNARMKTHLKRRLKEGKAGRTWVSLVGYTVEQLADHLEKQFQPGMTWRNMGDWHIDHRQPLSSFQFETAEDPEFKAAWALTNLQPLWNVDNWSKGGKRLLLL